MLDPSQPPAGFRSQSFIYSRFILCQTLGQNKRTTDNKSRLRLLKTFRSVRPFRSRLEVQKTKHCIVHVLHVTAWLMILLSRSYSSERKKDKVCTSFWLYCHQLFYNGMSSFVVNLKSNHHFIFLKFSPSFLCGFKMWGSWAGIARHVLAASVGLPPQQD